MKRKFFSRAVTAVLVIMMLVSAFPMTALASIPNWSENNVVYSDSKFGTNGYYNVISKKDYTLIPGAAVESEMVINNSTGTRRQVMHIIELDPSNPDVSVLPGYYNLDKLEADPADASAYKAAGVTEVAAYYENTLGYHVVGAMNTDLDYTDNAPRVLVYNHKNLFGYAGANAPSSVLYVWERDGEISCQVTSYKKAELEAGLESGELLHAISVSFGMVVKDGELVNKTEERTSSPAARSMVGVKPDGTLVIVMNDGRGANNSIGFCNYEEGEAMLALGCQWAANCDGGGSSSFVTRRAGEEDLVCRAVPCDGAERPTKASVIIASNVAPTGALDNVEITADYDYFAPYTTYTFAANAIDTHGYAMEMPADATWNLSDASFGTIENGTFVSSGKLGDVTIQIIIGGNVVGEKVITIANPTTLKFAADSTTLPYNKSTTLDFISLIGEENVYFDVSSFDFTLSNSGGKLNGFTFTAGDDESITDTVITALYKPTEQVLTYTVSFGKGSEVIYDFEDGDISNWKGTDEASAWLKENGVEKPFGTLLDAGQISDDCKTTTFLSTKENGKVHNGNNALGIEFDMTQVTFNSWVYGILYNTADSAVLRDVNNGKKATTLGMWMYMPEDFQQTAGKLACQLTVYVGKDGSGWDTSWKTTGTGYSGTQIHFQYNGTNLNALTESQIPENRWIYVTADISGYDYVALVDPLNDVYRSPSFLRTYIKPDVCRRLTWYIDDITLDYSSAVDDRVPPTISDPQYATADTNIAFTNGVTVNAESVAYTAYVSDDNSGIDTATAQIYIDGIAVATKISGNMIYTESIALGTGKHLVKFEVADKLGNITSLTRQIVSEYTTGDSEDFGTRLVLSGRNDSGETPMPGSVYYIDVVKAGTGKISEGATVKLSLNTANKWILNQLTVATGCDVSYTVNPVNPNEVTLTINNCENIENGVVFTVPVSVYNPASYGADGAISGRSFKAPLSVELFANTDSYSNYDKYSVASLEGNRTITRHEHTAHAIADKEAELGVAGYTDRTYCDVCASVVDWGTTIPALVHTHSYEIVGTKFVCSDSECGDVYEAANGLFEMNGKNYYAIGGDLVSGWQDVENDKYYFDKTTYEGINGAYSSYEVAQTGANFTYTFTNGKLDSGVWVKTNAGTRYFYGRTYLPKGQYEIDGKMYGFNGAGVRYEGTCVINWNPNGGLQLYEYTDEGVYVGELKTNGIFTVSNGDTYYFENGVAKFAGLVYEGGYYYYFGGVTLKAVKNCKATPTKLNGLLPYKEYEFDENGHIILNLKNGLVKGDDGNIRYYVNDVQTYAGLVQDTDGAYYYISGNGCIAVKNRTVYITKTNGLLPAGNYTFGADGRMIIKQGIVQDPDGNIRYYVNGVPTYAGLVKDNDGSYYYISGNGCIAIKDRIAYITKTNDLLPAGLYTFGADGKMIIKQGIVQDTDGNIRYYVDGVPTYAGLVKDDDGSYYYISGNGCIAIKDRTAYITKTNDLLPAGLYTFGADGKMIVD